MKRHITYYTYLFLGILLYLSVNACDTDKGQHEISFYKVEKMEKMTEKPIESEEDETELKPLHLENREMDVKVKMQFLKTENDGKKKICKLINDQLVEVLLKQSSEQNADDAVSQYIEEVKKDFRSNEVASIYHDYLDGIAEYGMKNVINYRLFEDIFTGGAHPCKQTTILRFNTQTGEFITLDAVFPTINHPQLQNLLLAKLMKDLNVHSINELHKMGVLEMTDMFISNNFALRDDSIEFYYNEYDIAPYAFGAHTICVSYDDVKDIISTTWENHK